MLADGQGEVFVNTPISESQRPAISLTFSLKPPNLPVQLPASQLTTQANSRLSTC